MAYFPPTGITSIVNSIPSSVLVGASIFGQLPAGTAPIGSIATLQGTNPWIVNLQNSSILAVPVGSIVALNIGSIISTQIGSVITVNQSSSILSVPVGSTIVVLQAPSIVGTYAEDAGSTTADKGLLTLGVRNDTVASLTSADLDYGAKTIDAVGRTIIKPFAGEDAIIISYNGSVVSGSVTLIQASAIGKRSYITDFWLSNTGSTTTLVTFQGGDTSVVGYGIAPGPGGSNSPGIAIPLKTTLSQDLAFKATTPTSVLYLTVKGYQAQ